MILLFFIICLFIGKRVFNVLVLAPVSSLVLSTWLDIDSRFVLPINYLAKSKMLNNRTKYLNNYQKANPSNIIPTVIK